MTDNQQQNVVVTTQATSKKFKLHKILSVCVTLVGVAWMGLIMVSMDSRATTLLISVADWFSIFLPFLTGYHL